MRIGYDTRGDILFVDLGTKEEIKARRKSGQRLSVGGAYVDLADDGTILSIEVEGASKRYSNEALAELNAYPDEPISLSEAARISGIDSEALKKAAQDGRLDAKKIGRNWTTTTGAVLAYRAGRKHAGPGSSIADKGSHPGAVRALSTTQRIGDDDSVSVTHLVIEYSNECNSGLAEPKPKRSRGGHKAAG